MGRVWIVSHMVKNQASRGFPGRLWKVHFKRRDPEEEQRFSRAAWDGVLYPRRPHTGPREAPGAKEGRGCPGPSSQSSDPGPELTSQLELVCILPPRTCHWFSGTLVPDTVRRCFPPSPPALPQEEAPGYFGASKPSILAFILGRY